MNPARVISMTKLMSRRIILYALLCPAAWAGPAANDPAIQTLVASGNYDNELCVTAQRVILNAGADAYNTQTLVAGGTTFMNEQMAADGEHQTVTVAMLLVKVKLGRKQLAVNAACKLVNQDRVNDVLGLNLPQPAGTCRDVNQLTYKLAQAGLSDKQRQRFLNSGTPLRFETDYKAAAGGEWIPSVISDFIKPVYKEDQLAYISVTAPSVQVPWPEEGGDWYQGTNHCKVITLAAMKRWMKKGALDGSTELFPRPRPKCVEPDSRTSRVGSCLLYFGPAGAQFCQDYSGSDWTESTAREDCAIRHPTLTAWNEGSDNYSGGGGIFNTASCADRDAVAAVAREPVNLPDGEYLGTCVFRCNTPNEVLWHQLTPSSVDPDGTMMERTCDLFLKVGW
jgi:hypothetical protein